MSTRKQYDPEGLCDCPVIDFQSVHYNALGTYETITVKHQCDCKQYKKCECSLIINKSSEGVSYDQHRCDCIITKKRLKQRKSRKRKRKELAISQMKAQDQYAIAYWIDYKKEYDDETRKNYTFNLYLMITSNNKYQKTVGLFNRLSRDLRMLIFDFLGETSCHNKASAYYFLMNRYLVLFTKPNIISYHYNSAEYSKKHYIMNDDVYRDNQQTFCKSIKCKFYYGLGRYTFIPDYRVELCLHHDLIKIIIEYAIDDQFKIVNNEANNKICILSESEYNKHSGIQYVINI